MEAKELGDKLSEELDRQAVSASTLLSKFRVIDESSRKSAQYCDHRHTPFYYYLGKHIQPKTLLEIGFQLGLYSGSFFKSCQTVDTFLTFQPKRDEFYSPRMAVKNILDVYRKKIGVHVGNISDDEFLKMLAANTWDLVFIHEEATYEQQRLFLDLVWPHVTPGGLVIVQHTDNDTPAGDVYLDFCKVHKRDPILVRTRYGTGIIEK